MEGTSRWLASQLWLSSLTALPSFFGGDDAPDVSTDASAASGEEQEEEPSTFELEFQAHKHAYYREKLHVDAIDQAFVDDMARRYVIGLQWVLLYYFKGYRVWVRTRMVQVATYRMVLVKAPVLCLG